MNFHPWTKVTQLSRLVNLRNKFIGLEIFDNPLLSSSINGVSDKSTISIVVEMRDENEDAV